MSPMKRRFTQSEISALWGKGKSFIEDQSVRICPACGESAIRCYFREGRRSDRSVLISYTWCAACRVMGGSTGPFPPGLIISDPFPEAGSYGDLSELFARLDQLWDKGVLPQKFHWSNQS